MRTVVCSKCWACGLIAAGFLMVTGADVRVATAQGIGGLGKLTEAAEGVGNQADVSALIKDVQSLLSSAQRNMFSGKRDEAVSEVKEAVTKLAQVIELDPENTMIASLRQKTEKLAGDLKRRTGVEIDLSALMGGDAAEGDPLTEADTLIREGERLMFTGKTEEALAKADAAAELLEKAKAAGADEQKLAASQSKADKLRADILRRMPKDEPKREDVATVVKKTPEEMAADLAKEMETQLRLSENNMHEGKNDEAYERLGVAAGLLAAIKEADPSYSRTELLEHRYTNLKETVEKRLGREVKPMEPQLAAAGVPEMTAADERELTNDLPYPARYPMNQVNQAYRSATGNFERYETQERDDMRDVLISRIGNNIEQMRENLEKSRQEAAANGVTEHPAFDLTESRIRDLEPRYLALKDRKAAADAEAAAMGDEIQKDGDALITLYFKLQDPYFNKAGGTAIYFNELSEAEAALAMIKEFEEKELPAAREFLGKFTAKYGSDEETLREKFDGRTYRDYYYPWLTYEELVQGIENVQKTREAMAEELVDRANMQIENNLGAKGHDFFRKDTHERIRKTLQLAAAYSPENAKVKEAIAGIDAILQKDAEEAAKRIDERTWPGNAADAPGDAKELAKVALDWFANSPDWGKRAQNPRAEDKEARVPLAVAIRGPWSVQKTNLLGQPTMYGVPAWLAVQLDREKPENVVRVYNVTLRTPESADPKMAPPFTSITVGDSWYMRPSAVKK